MSTDSNPKATATHQSPMRDVVSKMKKGARRVKRMASMSLPHFSATGTRRRRTSLDSSTRPNTTPLTPPITPSTVTVAVAGVDEPCDCTCPGHSYSFSDSNDESTHEYSSSSSSSALSSEVMSSNALDVVIEVPESPQIAREPKLEQLAKVAEETADPSVSQIFSTLYTEPDAPNPFLIDDDELPTKATPNTNKDVPPPPETDLEEDDAPDLYLPGLVMPTMFLPIPNTDPLTTLLTKYIYPPDKRPFRDSSGEWQNSNFNTLVMTNSWRALARMARDRLVTTNPEDLALILELWYLRLSSLARLRLFNQSSAECTNLFSVLNGVTPPDARDWLFERLLPFELEVMHTRLNYWAGDHMAYVDALNALLTKCRVRSRKSKDPTSMAMWKERGARIALILASQLMEMKDFGGATKLLEPLCNQQGTASTALRSTIARIYLQAGQIGRASRHMGIIAADPAVPDSVKDMNAALLATANGEWKDATCVLQRILETDAENYVAVNNLAVTLLGQGKLKDGIAVLEKALQSSPSNVVVAEPFLFNLSTLYELRSVTATEKKRDLLIEVAQWSGDGLRTTCLKMPTN